MTSENQETAPHQESIDSAAIDVQGKARQLSQAEQNKRKEAVAFATASINLSGFKATEVMRLLGERYVSGDIDLNEFVTLSQQMLSALDDAQPPMAQ